MVAGDDCSADAGLTDLPGQSAMGEVLGQACPGGLNLPHTFNCTPGVSIAARSGFEKLIAEVGLGRAGAVFSLEASRLARSCSDWYRLLEICALTDTLVIDEDGLYDPGQYNDRLLLGFRGTMSEAELHWLHTRLL